MDTTPIQFAYTRHDGELMRAIIEPLLENGDNTGTYRIFKDATDDDTTLFTDSKLIGNDNKPVNENDPDYLGTIAFSSNEKWHYDGEVLTESEQQQIAVYILQQYVFK